MIKLQNSLLWNSAAQWNISEYMCHTEARHIWNPLIIYVWSVIVWRVGQSIVHYGGLTCCLVWKRILNWWLSPGIWLSLHYKLYNSFVHFACGHCTVGQVWPFWIHLHILAYIMVNVFSACLTALHTDTYTILSDGLDIKKRRTGGREGE